MGRGANLSSANSGQVQALLFGPRQARSRAAAQPELMSDDGLSVWDQLASWSISKPDEYFQLVVGMAAERAVEYQHRQWEHDGWYDDEESQHYWIDHEITEDALIIALTNDPPGRARGERLANASWNLADLEQILNAEEWERLVEDILGADAFDADAFS